MRPFVSPSPLLQLPPSQSQSPSPLRRRRRRPLTPRRHAATGAAHGTAKSRLRRFRRRTDAESCDVEGAGQWLPGILRSGVGFWAVFYIFNVVFMYYCFLQTISYILYANWGMRGVCVPAVSDDEPNASSKASGGALPPVRFRVSERGN